MVLKISGFRISIGLSHYHIYVLFLFLLVTRERPFKPCVCNDETNFNDDQIFGQVQSSAAPILVSIILSEIFAVNPVKPSVRLRQHSLAHINADWDFI